MKEITSSNTRATGGNASPTDAASYWKTWWVHQDSNWDPLIKSRCRRASRWCVPLRRNPLSD